MFGQHAACGSCGFEFLGGHSHHNGSSAAVCTSCTCEFSLPTENRWGPHVDEVIELRRVVRTRTPGTKRKKPTVELSFIPTGTTFRVAASEQRGRVTYPVDDLRCPACRARGTLVLGFDEGEACPKCRTGRLACDQVDL